MKIALIIAVVVTAYFFWCKTRLKRRMRRLVDIAKITSCAIFSTHPSATLGEKKSESSQEITVAVATVNFLFGDTPCALHADLNLQEIHVDAIERIKDDGLLRELIVQSLRMRAILDYMGNGDVPLGALEADGLLQTFGAEYPISPSPDSYEQLIQKAIDTLSPDMQSNIRSRFGLLTHG